jgi:hypothetical protein
MKKLSILTGAALILAASAAYAAPKGLGGGMSGGSLGLTRGASEFSPGDRMRDAGGPFTGARGASAYAPGHLMKKSKTKTTRGASEFTPGDKMNDLRGR